MSGNSTFGVGQAHLPVGQAPNGLGNLVPQNMFLIDSHPQGSGQPKSTVWDGGACPPQCLPEIIHFVLPICWLGHGSGVGWRARKPNPDLSSYESCHQISRLFIRNRAPAPLFLSRSVTPSSRDLTRLWWWFLSYLLGSYCVLPFTICPPSSVCVVFPRKAYKRDLGLDSLWISSGDNIYSKSIAHCQGQILTIFTNCLC